MNRADIGRVQHQAIRTAMPGTTRQSAATAPIGSRGAFQRNQLQRGAPAHRSDTNDADDDDDKKEEPLVDRDELKDDDENTATDDDTLPSVHDSEDDEDDTDPKKDKKAKAA
jgi:hypothetical protein